MEACVNKHARLAKMMVVKNGVIFILRDYVLVLSCIDDIQVCHNIHHTFSKLPHTTKMEIHKVTEQ